MEVTCEGCKARLNIPDERIPKGKSVIISCPKCQKKLTVNTLANQKGVSGPASMQGSQDPGSKVKTGYKGEENDIQINYQQGSKLALVIENAGKELNEIKAGVEALEYQCIIAENTAKAIGKLQLRGYDLVILADGFDGAELEQSPILNYLNHMPISSRRQMFLVLLSDKYATMDHLTAFAQSANGIINRRDTESIADILKDALAEYDRFYRVLMETRKELGKD